MVSVAVAWPYTFMRYKLSIGVGGGKLMAKLLTTERSHIIGENHDGFTT